MVNLATGLKAFDPVHLIALAAIMGAGAAVGPKKAATAALGMTAIGLGIGGFFAGIAGAGTLAEFVGIDGGAIKKIMVNIADGLAAFDPITLGALAVFMGAGAVMGSSVAGLVAAGGAALGMTAIGLGIGGFFAAIAGIGDLADKFGVDGTGLKTIMINTADGLKAFEEVDGGNLKKIGDGMKGLGIGMVALLGVEGLGAIMNMGESLWKGVKGFFGGDTDTGEEKSQFAKLAEQLKEIDLLYVPNIDGEKFAKVIKGIADGLTTFTLIPQPEEGFFSWVGGVFSSKKEGPLESMFKVADRGEDLHKAGIGLDKIASALIRLSDVELNPKNLKDGINAIVDNATSIVDVAQDLPSTGSMTNGDAGIVGTTTPSTTNDVTTTTTTGTPTIGENIEFTQERIANKQNIISKGLKNRVNVDGITKGQMERAREDKRQAEDELKKLKALENALGPNRVMDKPLAKLQQEVKDAETTADNATTDTANGGGSAVINNIHAGGGGGGSQVHAKLPSDDVNILIAALAD